MNLKLLADPFPASDVEWRCQTAGEKNGKVWARVLAYINNRAIMERLDDVCGPENWRNEFRHDASGAVLCGISIRVARPGTGDDLWGVPDWVTKWDGAEKTDIEAVKGGLSNAMKRAGVQWGIGRYLYELEEGYANVNEKGAHYQSAKKETAGKPGYPAFKWDPPALPSWALPGGSGKPGTKKNDAGAKTAEGARSRAANDSEEAPTSHVRKPEARQQAAPASPSPAASKRDEDKMWGGKTLGEYTKDELKALITECGTEARFKTLVISCRAVLNNRALGITPKEETPQDNSDDARVQRMKDAEAKSNEDLFAGKT